VCVALDGENAWEYYKNDGRDFLKLLYQRLSQTPNLETTTVSGYLKRYPAGEDIKYLKPGSWVYGNLNKWIGSPLKNKAWEELIEARKELEHVEDNISEDKLRMAWKQIYILEGSDWFWWYDDTEEDTFDKLFHMHLSNFYKIIEK
ncbi:MAG: glycoside hydrolase family 57, partial [Candidatus Omnitrophica bacterium]|nr:glycoside hydrolase family 57 [Candidatus Omnitrophota bacterium]